MLVGYYRKVVENIVDLSEIELPDRDIGVLVVPFVRGDVLPYHRAIYCQEKFEKLFSEEYRKEHPDRRMILVTQTSGGVHVVFDEMALMKEKGLV